MQIRMYVRMCTNNPQVHHTRHKWSMVCVSIGGVHTAWSNMHIEFMHTMCVCMCLHALVSVCVFVFVCVYVCVCVHYTSSPG